MLRTLIFIVSIGLYKCYYWFSLLSREFHWRLFGRNPMVMESGGELLNRLNVLISECFLLRRRSPPELQNRVCRYFLWITGSNMVFALFCEGMLKICDKLSNPMLRDETSFSEFVLGEILIHLTIQIFSNNI